MARTFRIKLGKKAPSGLDCSCAAVDYTSRSLLVGFLYYRKMQFRKLHQLLHVWKSVINKMTFIFLYILLTRNNISVAFSKIEAISVDIWCFRFFNDYSDNKMCMNEVILTSLLFFIKKLLELVNIKKLQHQRIMQSSFWYIRFISITSTQFVQTCSLQFFFGCS